MTRCGRCDTADLRALFAEGIAIALALQHRPLTPADVPLEAEHHQWPAGRSTTTVPARHARGDQIGLDDLKPANLAEAEGGSLRAPGGGSELRLLSDVLPPE